MRTIRYSTASIWPQEWHPLWVRGRLRFQPYHHLGRLFDYIDQGNLTDNTLVLLLSDNGASAEGGRNGTLNEAAAGWAPVRARRWHLNVSMKSAAPRLRITIRSAGRGPATRR